MTVRTHNAIRKLRAAGRTRPEHALEEGAPILENELRRHTARDTGELQESIGSRVQGNRLRTAWGTRDFQRVRKMEVNERRTAANAQTITAAERPFRQTVAEQYKNDVSEAYRHG